jgi:cellulose synthase/poly-beta-1,6-N-acetylglucosamine synthase-like glycosyltransferase
LVVFDADTVVAEDFLRVMDAQLAKGFQVIQGNHIILNPDQGWLPAVMYIAFAMDNQLRNLGRSNLRLSSKLMGDGMCFTRSILENYPWQAVSQTEDVEYRAALSLAGIRVVFAPQAKAFGEMVTTLKSAGGQRARWMRGRTEVTRQWLPRLLGSGLRHLNWLPVDAALDLVLPSFSTLAVGLAVLSLLALVSPTAWIGLWLLVLWLGLLLYPVLALVLTQAPVKLYLYLGLAPFYAVWRTWLRLVINFQRGPSTWVRTARSTEAHSNVSK